MHDALAAAVDRLFPSLRASLEDLVRIPSVSAADFDPDQVRRSATATAELLTEAGFDGVRLLEIDGAHPAVYGHIPAPPGAPTVLLYAHHDVQPPGPDDEWDGAAFEPREQEGRLFGRGSSDDKAGIIMHVGAVMAHDGRPPVGVKVFVEGEEEVGSLHLDRFLAEYRDLLDADAIVIADAGNWRTGLPTLTTSLRGLVDCVVEVRTLTTAVHSGMFGGAIPDALTVLCRLLATLHDDDGVPTIPGRAAADADPLDLTEDRLREMAGTVDGVHVIGEGTLTSRIWTRPAVSVLAIDAPPVSHAINQLVPVARAKVSMRLAPGDEPKLALGALISHLEEHVPWGAQLTVTPGSTGEAFALDASGPAVEAMREAFAAAWDGTEPAEVGVGGSIPFVAAFSAEFPDAEILLTGAADDRSRPHGPNESVDLDDLRRSVVAEAIALQLLADR